MPRSTHPLQGGDYGAALDVLADLQAGLAGDPLHGLACFRSVLCPAASAACTPPGWAMHISQISRLRCRCMLVFSLLCPTSCCRHLPDQIAEAGASMHELIAADFLRGTAFTGLDAMADGVLATLRRVHHSAPPTTAGFTPDRRWRCCSQTTTRQVCSVQSGGSPCPTLCLHQVSSHLPPSVRWVEPAGYGVVTTHQSRPQRVRWRRSRLRGSSRSRGQHRRRRLRANWRAWWRASAARAACQRRWLWRAMRLQRK